MDVAKMRELGADELKAEEVKAAEQLFRVRFGKSLGKQEGIGSIRTLRKDIARMKTVARERQLSEQKAGK